MIKYLSTLGFSDAWLEALRAEVPDVDVRQITADSPGGVPGDVWRTVEVLHTGGFVPALDTVPKLRWVQLDTAGIDHLAGHPIWQTDIAVTTIGGVSPVPMAEYTMMMVLAWSHHLPEMLDTQRARYWPSREERWDRFLPRRVRGQTMVVIGFGRIGREIGRLARACGMQVIGVTRSGAGGTDDVEVVGTARLGDAVGRADVIVVVTPLTDETRGLVGPAVLAGVRPGVVLIDIARGGIVDEAELLRALDDGRIALAALDVFAEEPLAPEHPFWRHPRVIISPHVAGFAASYEQDVRELVAENLRRYAAGRPLHNRVDAERGY